MEEILDMKSISWVNKNSEQISALFPDCVVETAEGFKIDFDLLKQQLSTDIIESNNIFKIEDDKTISCVPNYFMMLQDIQFKKQ